MSEETIDLRTHIEAIMNERDRSYDSRFRASEIAVNAALAAQEKAVTAAFLASEKAIVKAEEAQREYNVGHNDLLHKMDDQYNVMMPREEALVRIGAIDAKIELGRTEIAGLRESRSESKGTKENKSENAIYVIAGTGIVISVISMILSVVFKFIH
jgi:hypothetical protein